MSIRLVVFDIAGTTVSVEETFTALNEAAVQVGINTGFSRDIADAVVNRLQWHEQGLIDHLVGSDEVELGRPHPYMIQKMMHDGGISDSRQVAKVGNAEVDIREGQSAGCRYMIGVTTRIFTRQELEGYHPADIIDDIAEVLNIIKN